MILGEKFKKREFPVKIGRVYNQILTKGILGKGTKNRIYSDFEVLGGRGPKIFLIGLVAFLS